MLTIPASRGIVLVTHLFDNRKMEQSEKTAEIFESSVQLVLDEIKQMLLEKNRKYGNSALSPVRVFSKANNVEQIKVRIDDKLSRLASGQSDEDEDVIRDIMGYLVLLRIAKKQ